MKTTRPIAIIAFLALCALTVDAQIETNIAWAKRETIDPYVADDIGVEYKVAGRVTSPSFSSTRTEMFIQDTNDNVGIQVWLSVIKDTNVMKVGVLASAQGYIGQSNGLRYIQPTLGSQFAVTDPTVVDPVPLFSQVSNFVARGEDYEGSYVVVSNATFAFTNWPAWGSWASNRITDGTGEIPLYIDVDTDIDGQLAPTNPFTLRGIASQRDLSASPSNGYQILPRRYADFIQSAGNEPPQIFVRNSNDYFSVGVNVELGIDLLGQDRNGEDNLILSLNSGPAGAAVTPMGGREARFTWTPDDTFIDTTNAATFEVTDGLLTNTVTVQITVRTLSGGPGQPWINEFHYDASGIETDDFVELAGNAGIILSNYYILLYNGNDGGVYASNSCSGVIDDEGHGFGAVWFPANGMQNGPDAIALCGVSNGVLQFISYEGFFTATNGTAMGLTSVDVGVSETGSEPPGQSLQLQGNGTNYEAFTWSGPMPATPGDLNGAGQIIIGPVNAKLSYSGLTLSPAAPSPAAAFDVECVITPNYSASNLVATAWYRINGGAWNSIGMSVVGGYTNKTTSQVPGQTNGTPIDYYVSTVFDGPNAPSPAVSATNSDVILAFPPTIATLTNVMVEVSNAVQFAVHATEPDGDLITLTGSNVPANANFYPTNGVSAADGSFVFTPDATQVGVHTTTFYAVDKDGVVASNVVITVRGANSYLETFDTAANWGGGTMSSYNPKFYTNNALPPEGDWFTGSNVVRETAYVYGGAGYSWRIGNDSTPNVYWRYICSTGVQSFSFYIARWDNTPTPVFEIRYSTNTGASYTTLLATNGAWFNDVGDKTNKQFVSGPLNIVPEAGQQVYVEVFRSTGERMLIDQFELEYGGGSGGGGDVDGIPVSWWDRYNIPALERIATNNPDDDPDSNFEEFVADTDPTNDASYFVYEVTNMTGVGTLQLLVGPPTTNSRVYDAFWCSNLINQGWTAFGFDVPGQANGSAFYLTVTNDAGGRFYRTGVKVP